MSALLNECSPDRRSGLFFSTVTAESAACKNIGFFLHNIFAWCQMRRFSNPEESDLCVGPKP